MDISAVKLNQPGPGEAISTKPLTETFSQGRTPLTRKGVAAAIAYLESYRREREPIAAETIEAWYVEAQRIGWTQEFFDARIHRIKDNQYPITGRDIFAEHVSKPNLVVVSQEQYDEHIAFITESIRRGMDAELRKREQEISVRYFGTDNGKKQAALQLKEMELIQREASLNKKAEKVAKIESRDKELLAIIAKLEEEIVSLRENKNI